MITFMSNAWDEYVELAENDDAIPTVNKIHDYIQRIAFDKSVDCDGKAAEISPNTYSLQIDADNKMTYIFADGDFTIKSFK